jgi:hypothetical protein
MHAENQLVEIKQGRIVGHFASLGHVTVLAAYSSAALVISINLGPLIQIQHLSAICSAYGLLK